MTWSNCGDRPIGGVRIQTSAIPRKMPSMPRVTMNDGIRKRVVRKPLTKPMPAPTATDGRHRQPGRPLPVEEHLRDRQRQQPVHGPDREVDLAGDEEEGHPGGQDRQQRDLHRDAEDVVLGEERRRPGDGEGGEEPDRRGEDAKLADLVQAAQPLLPWCRALPAPPAAARAPRLPSTGAPEGSSRPPPPATRSARRRSDRRSPRRLPRS